MMIIIFQIFTFIRKIHRNNNNNNLMINDMIRSYIIYIHTILVIIINFMIKNIVKASASRMV